MEQHKSFWAFLKSTPDNLWGTLLRVLLGLTFIIGNIILIDSTSVLGFVCIETIGVALVVFSIINVVRLYHKNKE